MVFLPAHQSVLFLHYASLVVLVALNLLPLLLQQFQHRSLLALLDLKHLCQRHQILVLLLGKVDPKTWKVNAQHLLVFVLELLISNGEVHIVYQRKYSFPHSAIFKLVTLLHEGVVPQKSRTDNHRKFLKTLTAVAFDSETAEVQAPALIFVERTDENRTVDLQFHIQYLLQLEVFLLKGVLLLYECFVLFDRLSFHDILSSLFEVYELFELLHVYLLVNDRHLFHTSINCLLQYSVILQKLTFVPNLQKRFPLLFFFLTTIKTLHAVLLVRAVLVLLRFLCGKYLQFFVLCLLVLLKGKK